jgi:hypothetical protein
MLRAPLRRSVHIEIIQRTIGGMYLTILSGTYAVLTSYPAQFRDATQRSANHISLQSSASTSTTGVLRLDPNNSLESADAIVSFSTRLSQLQHAQTLVSSSPVHNISHCVQKLFIPASTGIRQYPSFDHPMRTRHRAQSVNCRIQDRSG